MRRILFCLLAPTVMAQFSCGSLSSLMTTNWSENYALAELGAEASHPYLNDGKYSTVAETKRKADPREFIVQLPGVKRVRRIRLANDNLYRFALDYWDVNRGEWRNVKTVQQRRDVEGYQRVIQAGFDFTGINFETDKLRVTVSRTVDDKIVSKTAPEPDDKILDHRRDIIGGTWIEYYRIIVESTARLKEVEVFGIAPSEG